MINIVFVKNPFDMSYNQAYQVPFVEGNAVRIYTEPYISYCPDTDFHISINGHLLEKYEIAILCPTDGDQIVIIPVVGKGLGSLLGSIATMWLMGVVGGAGFLPHLSVGVRALAQGLTMYIGGRIINAILPPPKQNLSASQTTSPTYGWDGAKPIAATGTPLGRTFGTVKPSPVVLARHVTTDGDKQYLNILYGGGEGPIDSIDNITIDGNPIANYTDVQVDIRLGTNEQEPISNFGDTFADQSLNYELSSTTWATQQTEGNAGRGLEVTFQLPYGLYHTKDDGSLENASVKVAVQYRKVGISAWTDWSLADNGTITAAKNTAVYKVYRLDNLAAAQYEIRCQCYYKQGTDTRYSTRIYWSQLSHILYNDFARPNKVLVGIKALATDQLSGSDPNVGWTQTRSKVNVWNPSTNQYEQKPATNPYWACYDMIHNCKYLKNINTGQYEYVVEGNPISRIDYPTFLENANYSAELIDGDPRFELSLYLDAEISFWDALARIAVVGRGVIVPKGTKYSCICDKPAIPTQLFTMGNITEKSFKGKFQSVKDRSQCIEVDFYNELKDYKQDLAIYYGDEYNTTTQIPNPTKVTRYGISKYKYAYREAIFLYKGNKYLKRTVDWEADIDAIACKPGDVVLLAHDVPKWGAASGRIVAATTTTVTLDQQVTLQSGKNYAVVIRLKTDERVNHVISTVATDIPTNTLTLVEPFTTIPERYDIFSFGESYKVTKPFKVINIVKTKDLQCKLSGVEYIEDMYSDVVDIPIINYSSYDNTLVEVENLSIGQETYRQKDGMTISVIHCSWTMPRGKLIKETLAYISKDNGISWQLWGSTLQSSIIIMDVQSLEAYLVKVCTINELGLISKGVISNPIYILGKDKPPASVPKMTITQAGTNLNITIEPVLEPDIAYYELRYGVTWDNSILVQDFTSNSLIIPAPSNGTLTYWVKAFDNSGNQSLTATIAIVNVVGLPNKNIIYTQTPTKDTWVVHHMWQDKDNRYRISSRKTLGDYDKFADIFSSTLTLWDDAEILLPVIDLGRTVLDESSYWIDRKGNMRLKTVQTIGDFAKFSDIFGATLTYIEPQYVTETFVGVDVSYVIKGAAYVDFAYRTSLDGSKWNDWIPGLMKQFSGRYVQVKILPKSVDGKGQVYISGVTVNIDVPDIDEIIENIAIPAAVTRITYTKKFTEVKTIDPYTRDHDGYLVSHQITNRTNEYFDIILLDKNGNPVSGILEKATIRGY